MAQTFCNRCGDAVEEGCDPWDELAELDALTERLRLKRYDLKRKINRVHSPIVRQLPPDVTSTIFEFCLPDFADDHFSRTKNFFIPLSLGSICSYWREIAWSTPSLWSSLVVDVPSEHDSHLVTCLAQEWLARSGQLPLSIRILRNFYGFTISQALADIINQYSARWSDLDLDMPKHCYQRFHATDNHAPILKSVRFWCPDYNTGDLNFQLTCPRLERADLAFFPIDGTIQWDNLTHLTFHSMYTIDSFVILRKTPRLVFCKVSASYLGLEEPSILGAPTSILTSLRSLQITSSADELLNNFIAPHLEELSLSRYFDRSTEAITSFLRRSACSLRSFSMILYIFPYFEGFMSLLQSIPSLNTLSIMLISTIYITPEDYDARNILQLVAKVLSSQSTSLRQGFLPNLEILEYTGMLYLRPGNYGDLYPLPPADNVAHPLHLLKLDLYPVTRIPKNAISYFLSLAERGVTVNVMSKSKDILQSSIDYYRCRKDFLSRDWTDNFESSLFLDFCGVSQFEK